MEAASMDAEEGLLLIKEIQMEQLEENYKTSLLLWSNREAACITAGVKAPEPPPPPELDEDGESEGSSDGELSGEDLLKLLESE